MLLTEWVAVMRYALPAWLCKPGRSRSLASPCFIKGEVYLYAASELADTNPASKLTCRHMMTSQFRSERWKEPFGKPNGEKTGDFERFLPFFRPCIFSEFHRSLLPFSMLCPDLDSRKGLFCVFPKAIDSVAGFGLAKAESDSVKKLSLHKLFTNTIDPSSNCPDLNSRN